MVHLFDADQVYHILSSVKYYSIDLTTTNIMFPSHMIHQNCPFARNFPFNNSVTIASCIVISDMNSYKYEQEAE